MYRWWLFLILLNIGDVLYAQDPVNSNISDTTVFTDENLIIPSENIQNIVTETPRNRPNKAALYSAIFPGAGQVFNGKSWKLPIIYGGAAVLIYGINNYNTQYHFFLDKYLLEVDGDETTINDTGLNQASLQQRKDFFRRNRDYFMILLGVLYGLNIVDAHVDAHLREFDINDDLSVSIKPSMARNPWNIPNIGVTVQFNLNP